VQRESLSEEVQERMEDSDEDGLVDEEERLREEEWLEKFNIMSLNNAESMVANRLQAIIKVAMALHRRRFGYANERQAELRPVFQQAASTMMENFRQDRKEFEDLLREHDLLSKANVTVSASEQKNLLAHIEYDEFVAIEASLKFEFVNQLMLTKTI